MYDELRSAGSSSLGAADFVLGLNVGARVSPIVPSEAIETSEDTSHAALMSVLDTDPKRTASLIEMVTYVARTRYGIRAQDAGDVFNNAVATYLVVHGRYPPGDNHFGILVGIFHRKALEYQGSFRNAVRLAERLAHRWRADRPVVARGEDPAGTVSDRLIRQEDTVRIRRALETLTPESRDLLLALAEGRTTQLEVVEELGIKRNTFYSRLRTLRLQLCEALGPEMSTMPFALPRKKPKPKKK